MAASATTAWSWRSTASTSRSGPARSSSSPGCRGMARRSSSRRSPGCDRSTLASASIAGHHIEKASPREVSDLGVAHIPEDRGRDGLINTMTVAENYILDTYHREPYSRRGILHREVVAERAAAGVKEFDIRTPSIDTLAGSLSGGNQQKVVVAREFSVPVKLVLAAQPTRGLDVGSIEYIHRRLIEQRDAGAAILLVSTELDEVVAVGDRIVVMFEGHIVGEVERRGRHLRTARPDDGRCRIRGSGRVTTAGQLAREPSSRSSPSSPPSCSAPSSSCFTDLANLSKRSGPIRSAPSAVRSVASSMAMAPCCQAPSATPSGSSRRWRRATRPTSRRPSGPHGDARHRDPVDLHWALPSPSRSGPACSTSASKAS